MILIRLLLLVTAVSLIPGCDLFGGDGGSDDPYTPVAPPDEPPTGDPDPTPSYTFTPFSGSGAYALNESGEVIGRGPESSGAWFYSEGTTRGLGWTDVESTPPDASQRRYAIDLNESGQVIGFNLFTWAVEEELAPTLPPKIKHVSFRRGSAWLYSGGAYTKLGLTDVGSAYPVKYSDVQGLNEAGQVTGHSSSNGETCFINEGLGFSSCEVPEVPELSSAWLYSDGSTHDISLIDGDHTGEDGSRNSTPEAMNEAGDVIGTASRYSGLGTSCWLYSKGTTYHIGMIDDEHTNSSTGSRLCSVQQLNETAQVLGFSERGGSGYTVWFYSEGSTFNIGLTDSAHTDINGYRVSSASELNEAGQVAGISTSYLVEGSERFGGGSSAWLFENGVTKNISLIDQEHTRSDGYRWSEVAVNIDFAWLSKNVMNDYVLNDAGQVMGHSTRFGPADENLDENLGQTAWLYTNGSHTRLGLTDGKYTNSEGFRYSDALRINQAGQVAGHSKLYDPDMKPDPCGSESFCGARTAWFYDPKLGKTIRLALSSRSDGFEFSEVIHLSEDGTLSGYYLAFEDGDNTFEWRFFNFSLEHGLQDADVVGMERWEFSSPPSLSNDSGHIVGSGKLAGSSSSYLLSPLPDEAE